MRYYVVYPDKTEDDYPTLAEAQSRMRFLGGVKSGYRVDARRG